MDGATKIDPLIDSIQWKKEFSRIIVSDKEPYKILNQSAIATSDDLEDLNADPNYLGKDVFDIHNLFARIFEDSLADYLRDQGYSATTRFKDPYFQSDIDVDVGGTIMKIQTSWDLIYPYMKKICIFQNLITIFVEFILYSQVLWSTSHIQSHLPLM